MDSDVIQQLDYMLMEAQQSQDLILDLTPLTKLLTIKFLAYSTKFHIPSFYLGMRGLTEYEILWINKTGL